MNTSEIAEWITATATVFLLGGVIAAFVQARAATRTIRGQFILHLIDAWQNDTELCDAIKYLHDLRRDWKRASADIKDWETLANQWVQQHVRIGEDNSLRSAILKKEWFWRRRASQALAKLGMLIERGYLKPEDVFGTIPEASRILLVLVPIENQIAEYFRGVEEPLNRKWDRPFNKWEFKKLWAEFLLWFERNGTNLRTSTITLRQMLMSTRNAHVCRRNLTFGRNVSISIIVKRYFGH